MKIRLNKFLYILINIVLPIFLGSFIYLIYRSEEILLFSWLNILGVDDFINFFRKNIFLDSRAPLWFKYNLQDGLWVYSLNSFMLLIWENELSSSNIYYFLLFPFLACLIEGLQFFQLLSGTYDSLDILFYLICGFIPILFFLKKMI